MKRHLPYSLAVSSLILLISCDSSETDEVTTKQEPLLLEDENKGASEEKVVEPEPLSLEIPALAAETQASSEAVVDYEYFHKALAPMGTWYETAEYGSVWQPQASREVNWAPYTRGRWVYCDQGWAWISTEAFGWATYHYGRWAKLETQGWVWVPGTEWAPNWCSWRSNDSHIGWAPLPPETLAFSGSGWDSTVESRYGITASCYSFVKLNHFDRSIFSNCLPASQIVGCFEASRNITSIRFLNDRFYCGGPGYRDLSGRLGRQLPFCQLKRSRDFSSKAISVKLRNRVDGDDLIVNAPKVRSTGLFRTRAQKVAVRVQRGEKTDPSVIEAFRQMREREVASVRNRGAAQDTGKRITRPAITRSEPKSRVIGKQPSSQAKEEAASNRKIQAEINRRQQQEAMAMRRIREQAETAEREAAERLRIDAQRRQREVAHRAQQEKVERQRVEAQRKERETVRRQQKEEDERQAVADRRSARQAMQRKQRETAQREQEEDERRERIAEQEKEREEARRKQEEDEQRKKIEAQRKAREEIERREREEAKRQQEAEEERRRIAEEKKQREDAARRRKEEKEAEEERRRIEEQEKQREEAERKRQEEEQRQRVEEQRRSREEARRKEREETERQRQKRDPSRRRGR